MSGKFKMFTAFAAAVMLAGLMSVTASAGTRGTLYVFYSAPFQDYMYTASESEKRTLEEHYYTGIETYQYIGTAGTVMTSYEPNAIPVYRFWNETTRDHFYTADKDEKEQVESNYYSGKDDYVYEGIAFYASGFAGVPVYRFFDPVNFNHYYTNDFEEKAYLCDMARTGNTLFQYEKVAWYQ